MRIASLRDRTRVENTSERSLVHVGNVEVEHRMLQKPSEAVRRTASTRPL